MWHYLNDQSENCTYSPEPEGESSGPSCSATCPSALLRMIPTLNRSFSRDNEMASYLDFLCGITSRPFEENPGEGTSMSSQAGSLVLRSLPPENEKGSRRATPPGSGLSSPGSSGKSGRRKSSSKTLPTYALADLCESSKILPAWGTMRSGVCWERTRWAPRISENECGALPSPTTRGNELSPSMQKWPAHQRLAQLVERLVETGLTRLPTTTTKPWQGNGLETTKERTKEKKLPTPTAKLYGNNRGGAAGRTGKVRPSLESLTGGPWIVFREWMMAMVIGWTALEVLEMPRFRSWLVWHTAFLSDVLRQAETDPVLNSRP